MFSVLVSLVLSASPPDGTPLDVRAFQVVKQSSGPVDYYRVETGPDGPYLAARYHPPLDTVVKGVEAPEAYRRTLAGVRWRWRVRAFPKGGDDCNPDVGDAAAGRLRHLQGRAEGDDHQVRLELGRPGQPQLRAGQQPLLRQARDGPPERWADRHLGDADRRPAQGLRPLLRRKAGGRPGLRRHRGAHRRRRHQLEERGGLRRFRPAGSAPPARHRRGRPSQVLRQLADAGTGTVTPTPPAAKEPDAGP